MDDFVLFVVINFRWQKNFASISPTKHFNNRQVEIIKLFSIFANIYSKHIFKSLVHRKKPFKMVLKCLFRASGRNTSIGDSVNYDNDYKMEPNKMTFCSCKT